MRPFTTVCVTSLLILVCSAPHVAQVKIDQANIESAKNLFNAGMFSDAKKAGADLLAKEPKNYQASLLMGRIALLANRLVEAQKWLTEATKLKPEESVPKSLLAEVFYRRDDFQKSALLLRAVGREACAQKLESFKGSVPYQVGSKLDVVHLKFVQTDPLPVVRVRVNDSEEVNFMIDTGGGEVIVDPEFAASVKAARFGPETGTFGGGKQSAYAHGRVDSLTLGEFTVRNVPVNILSTRRFSAVTGGKRVDGIIGAVLLYHFLSTLDYGQGELVLRRKTSESSKLLAQKAPLGEEEEVPFLDGWRSLHPRLGHHQCEPTDSPFCRHWVGRLRVHRSRVHSERSGNWIDRRAG